MKCKTSVKGYFTKHQVSNHITEAKHSKPGSIYCENYSQNADSAPA